VQCSELGDKSISQAGRAPHTWGIRIIVGGGDRDQVDYPLPNSHHVQTAVQLPQAAVIYCFGLEKR
jgi:hypothetical protein